MRPVVVALLGLLIVSADAAAKDTSAPERVLWNSTPHDIRAGDSWGARLSLLQGPGGFYSDKVHPVIVVTELAGGAERRVPMTADLSANTFKATVPFSRAGLYEVAVAGFDPHDPARFVDTGPPVHIRPAASLASAAAGSGDIAWPWVLGIGAGISALLAGAWSIRRS
jgi:hypothetical protein